MDVDGTLTDGRVYMSDKGECMKVFDIKDGYAINELLPVHGIIPAIITGRRSDMLTLRCEELHIKHVFQGVSDKVAVLQKLMQDLNLDEEAVAYIGDDNNDLACMQLATIVACPSDASPDVLAIADYISSKPGGRGAVREFVEWLVR